MYIILAVLMAAIAWFPVIIVHELGHMLVAAWRGARGFSIHFGHGSASRKVELALPLVKLVFGLGPGLWLNVPRYYHRSAPPWRPWEQIIVAVSGPLAALALFLLLGGSLKTGLPLFLAIRYPIHSMLDAFQFMALNAFLAPLFPIRYRSLNDAPSDGLRILLALRAMGQNDRAGHSA